MLGPAHSAHLREADARSAGRWWWFDERSETVQDSGEPEAVGVGGGVGAALRGACGGPDAGGPGILLGD